MLTHHLFRKFKLIETDEFNHLIHIFAARDMHAFPTIIVIYETATC
jgi:hypothetical protein